MAKCLSTREKNIISSRYGEVEVAKVHSYSQPVQGFRISAYLQELMVVAGVTDVYASGNELLEQLLRIPVSASSVYRVTVATAKNLEDEALYQPIEASSVYAQVDGSMVLTDEGWQEVKAGRIFSHDAVTGKAELQESRYCAYLGSYPAFCERFEKLLPATTEIVFISDGAEWIKQWVERSYPRALQILDYYHAVEHLANCPRLNAALRVAGKAAKAPLGK